MKKFISILCALALMCCALALTVSAKAPADAQMYADFNHGPLANPEESMQATDNGGTLYINNGPINADASLVDGALKLTLGPSGYYGMNNPEVALRDPDGNLTSYKYLVIRMKGEFGTENTPGVGGLMMSIGGGDGPHLGTFVSSGDVPSFLDPDGCYMPLITTEYQDFVIALTQANVRVNEGKLVSGINFNNSMGNVTIYIDEIYLTSEIPEGFVSSGKKAEVSNGASGEQGGATIPVNTPGSSGAATESVLVTGSSSGTSLAVIIALMVVVFINLMILVVVLLKLTAPAKPGKSED